MKIHRLLKIEYVATYILIIIFIGTIYSNIQSAQTQEAVERIKTVNSISQEALAITQRGFVKAKAVKDATKWYDAFIPFDEDAFKKISPAYHVIAHRGAPMERIEHTFDSYDLAIEYGVKCIEQDIVLSADGTLYVSHDHTARRLFGTNASFISMVDSEIDALRTAEGYPVLKLADVFDRYDTSIIYVIELKGDLDIVDPYVRLVEEYGLEDYIILQSFNFELLKNIEDVYPNMPKLALCSGQGAFENALTLDYIDIIGVNKNLMNRENCERTHIAGKEFNAWSLYTEESIRNAIDIGVDSYFTDYPGLAMMLEKESNI